MAKVRHKMTRRDKEKAGRSPPQISKYASKISDFRERVIPVAVPRSGADITIKEEKRPTVRRTWGARQKDKLQERLQEQTRIST
jgi:hypothetical protein